MTNNPNKTTSDAFIYKTYKKALLQEEISVIRSNCEFLMIDIKRASK